MVSSSQLLVYGALAAVPIAFIAARWTQWQDVEITIEDLADKLFETLLTDAVSFALPAAYARFALPCPWTKPEPWPLKILTAGGLGVIALINLAAARRASVEGTSRGVADFGGLLVAHVASYCIVPLLERDWQPLISLGFLVMVLLAGLQREMPLETAQVLTAFLFCYLARSRLKFRWHLALAMSAGGGVAVPYLIQVLNWLLPLREMVSVYHTIKDLLGTRQFEEEVCEILIVTGYVQMSLGYVGIWYMRRGQARTNSLLDVADGKLDAWGFVQRVGLYMLVVAAPYMMQRTIMETANALAFYAFLSKVDQHVRVDSFFSAGESPHNRLEVVLDSEHTVDAYAESVIELMTDCYAILERKLFGLPNLLLMSDTLLSQPALMMAVLPASVVLDFSRARIMSFLTSRVEQLTKYLRKRLSMRKKIEEHDVRHAETISRTGAAPVVASRWEDLAGEIFQLTAWRKCLVSFRTYLNWIYYTNIVGVGIECALARMMELGSITAADLGVYAQVGLY